MAIFCPPTSTSFPLLIHQVLPWFPLLRTDPWQPPFFSRTDALVRLYADDLVGSFKLAVKRRPQQHSSPRSFRNPSPLSLPSLKRNELLGALEVRDDARPSNCSLTDLLFPFFAALSCEGLGFNLLPGKIGGDHLPWSADSRWGPRR